MSRTPVTVAESPRAPTHREAGRFVLRTTVIHVVTYFIVGIAAALIVDYERLFETPVVRDYMRPFGSVALFVGPVVQILRGVVTAAVLLPFRARLRERRGWLWLWLLLVVIGILSTSAAAPSSIEGVVYTQLPLWYHAVGLPEMLVQTLGFSVLVAAYERHPRGLVAELPTGAVRVLEALVAASLAFVGYAVASVAFALAAGADVAAPQNLTWEVQGLFLAPFLLNAVIAFLALRGPRRWRGALLAAAASYVLGVAAILGYQAIVSGEPALGYALVAPVLPAAILALVLGRRAGRRQPSGG